MKNFVFSSKIFKGSRYGEGHPLNIDRVWPSLELLKIMNWVSDDEIIFNQPASIEELTLFHDYEYLKALKKAEMSQNLSDLEKKKFKIGVGVNPIFKEVFSRPAAAAKSSMTAIQFLAENKANKILNFSGGTHHGRQSFASGFCFLNDCVLAILKAKELNFKNILYIDIDAHHCDAVQDHFENDDTVNLISLHEQNKWPRTGKVNESYIKNVMNIPVPQNFNDNEMLFVVDKLILPYAKNLNPDLVIVQAGTDCLHDDPQSNMSLSNFSYWQTVSKLKDISMKTLILGGGGYNPYLTAKAWAGNWLVLNSKEKLLDTNLTEECQKLLKSLSWKNSRVRNGIPNRWLDNWLDNKNSSLVRDEIKRLVDEIKKIKKL